MRLQTCSVFVFLIACGAPAPTIGTSWEKFAEEVGVEISREPLPARGEVLMETFNSRFDGVSVRWSAVIPPGTAILSDSINVEVRPHTFRFSGGESAEVKTLLLKPKPGSLEDWKKIQPGSKFNFAATLRAPIRTTAGAGDSGIIVFTLRDAFPIP